ncbi:transglutaminase-like domain-containing protein [Candidatus Riflebacteria bacterium]
MEALKVRERRIAYLYVLLSTLSYFFLAKADMLLFPLIILGLLFSYFMHAREWQVSDNFSNLLSLIAFLFLLINLFGEGRDFRATTAYFLIVLNLAILFKVQPPYFIIFFLSFILLINIATMSPYFAFYFHFVICMVVGIWAVILSQAVSELRIRRIKLSLKDRLNFMPYLFVCSLIFPIIFSFFFGLFLVSPDALKRFFSSFVKDSKTAFSKIITLGNWGHIRTDRKIIMRLKFEKQEKFERPVYVFGTSLKRINWNFKKWQKDLTEPKTLTSREFLYTFTEAETKKKLRKVEVFLNPLGHSTLFSVRETGRLEIPFSSILFDADGMLALNHDNYEYLYYTLYTTQDNSRRITLAEDEKKDYLKLPPLGRRQFKLIANKWVKGERYPLEKALKIQRILRTKYTYSLVEDSKEYLKKMNPVFYFLQFKRKGHCEYFASSMVVLLRALRIPARIVTGFYTDEFNPYGKYMVVRNSMAHAWVEAYIKGRWITFEPTPGGGLELAKGFRLNFFERLGAYLDSFKHEVFLWAQKNQSIMQIGFFSRISGNLRDFRKRLFGLFFSGKRGKRGVSWNSGVKNFLFLAFVLLTLFLILRFVFSSNTSLLLWDRSAAEESYRKNILKQIGINIKNKLRQLGFYSDKNFPLQVILRMQKSGERVSYLKLSRVIQRYEFFRFSGRHIPVTELKALMQEIELISEM